MTATILVLVTDGPRSVANVSTFAHDDEGEGTFAERIEGAASTAAKGANSEIEKHLRRLSEATH